MTTPRNSTAAPTRIPLSRLGLILILALICGYTFYGLLRYDFGHDARIIASRRYPAAEHTWSSATRPIANKPSNKSNGHKHGNGIGTTVLRQYSDPRRWATIPQGWYDKEPYTSEDNAVCRLIPASRSARFNNLTIASGVLRPLWTHKKVFNDCGRYTTIQKCHRVASGTCQWSLQGYCFNYTAPNIVWINFEVVPGGLTNQHHAVHKGLAIIRYVQRQLGNKFIVATLLPRVHRNSPTRGEGPEDGKAEDFRPFRHFFDASSVLCPLDMGPFIERPRMRLIESLTNIHYVSLQGKRIYPPFKHGYQPYFCAWDKSPALTQTKLLYKYIRDNFSPSSTSTSTSMTTNPLVMIGRTFFCNMNDEFMAPFDFESQPLAAAPYWHYIADTIAQTMQHDDHHTHTRRGDDSHMPVALSPSPSTSSSSSLPRYVGLHIRRERDMCDDRKDDPLFAFCQWTAVQWMACINRLLSVNHLLNNITLGYVATGNAVLESSWYTPFVHNSSSDSDEHSMTAKRDPNHNVRRIKWHTKLSAMASLTESNDARGTLLDGLLREELALIDELVMIKSHLFTGVVRSSFSKQIKAKRRYRHPAPSSSLSYFVDKTWPQGCLKL